MFDKKIVKLLFGALFILVLLASCKSEVEIPINKKYHTITFNTNGGTNIESVVVEKGSLLKKESFIPEKDGHIFKEWKTEDGFVYDFSTPITEDITLYANYYIEADDDIEKKMYSLYLVSKSLYKYDDEEKEKTVLDAFGEKYLLEITGALYGDNEGFFSDTYFTKKGSPEKYYLYSEDYESIYENDTYSLSNLEGLNFELKDCDNTPIDKTFLIQVKNLGFKADFTEPEKTINVNFSATLKVTFDSEINRIVRYDLNLVSDGETYSPFSFEYKEDGFEVIYGDYCYSHVHEYGEWIEIYPPSESNDGDEYRSCQCGFFEERAIPKLNQRNIQVLDKCEKTYDGKPIDISSAVTFTGEGIPTFEYKLSVEKDDKYSPKSPKDAGEYTIRITLDPSGEYDKKSQKEVDYTINRAVISNTDSSITGIFKGEENKVYNGQKQVWEAKITNKDTRGISAFTNIVDGETITVRLISDEINAKENLYFNYNYSGWSSPGGTIEVLDNDGKPLHNYELSICNETVNIVPIKLGGEINTSKQFDRSSEFVITDLSSLEGILDCDKNLVLEASKLNDYITGVKNIDYIRFYLNDSPTNNYTIESSQIKAEIVPRILTIGEYGGTIRTPVLPGVDNRAIILEKRNNTIKIDDEYETGYLIITSSDEKISSASNDDVINSTELNYELNISYDSYYKFEEPLPNLAFVNVTTPIDEFSVNSLGEDSYYAAFFELDSGKRLVINIGKGAEGDLVPYICDANGKHHYFEYSKNDGSRIEYNLSGKSYFFLYSKSGTSNIEFSFDIQQIGERP